VGEVAKKLTASWQAVLDEDELSASRRESHENHTPIEGVRAAEARGGWDQSARERTADHVPRGQSGCIARREARGEACNRGETVGLSTGLALRQEACKGRRALHEHLR
jgi:hypothetical protein